MTRGIRTRLILFVLLAAVGVSYVSATYLGLVDTLLGRGFTVTAELDGTGGLYAGGEVTYRGVRIGEVGDMNPAKGGGVDIKLNLEDNAKVPVDSPMFVHNGSAVGEQYLDFEPASDAGPYLKQGDVIHGTADTLPVDEADLLVDMDRFVSSVNQQHLSSVIGELGQMFYNTGRPLQDIVDGSTRLIDAARANQAQTIRLLGNGRTVLQTQADNATSIRDFASGLNDLTGALRASDRNIRTILEGGPSSLQEIKALLTGLQPTIPVFLSNLVTVNQVVTVRLSALEQLLVTYPALIAGGFTGTTPDGYGHVSLQYNNDVPPCTEGYLPPSQWRPGSDVSDGQIYLKAHCASPLPYNARGSAHAPSFGGGARVAPYDPSTGTVGSAGDGAQWLVIGDQGANDVYGEDAWKWMLIGPTTEQ